MEVLPTDPTARVKLGLINQAKEKIAQLKYDFRDEALRKSVFIVVYGTRAKQTKKILTEQFGVRDGSPRNMVAKIVDKLDAGLYNNRQLHPSVIDMSSAVLDDLASNIGVDHVPAFYYDGHKHAVQLNNRGDLERVLEKVVLEKVGGEIFAVDAVMDSLDQLIADEYDQPVLPVVMETTEDNVEKLSNDLKRITPNVFVMGAGVEAGAKADLKLGSKAKLDKGVIEKALVQIKNSLK
jgi:hypothetical protein